MSKWQEVLKQHLQRGEDAVLVSKENLESALAEHGCTREEIDIALSEFGGFPLDDDDLEMITGGISMGRPMNSVDPADREIR